jgi:uncharacterized protein (DUF433 family)
MATTLKPRLGSKDAQSTDEYADARSEVIWADPRRVSGTPCFRGTRVPVQTLFDYILDGETLDGFLAGFPGVSRDQAEQVLNLAGQSVVEGIDPERTE